MRIIIISIIIFLIIGSLIIINFNNLKLKNPDDRSKFISRFGNWVFGVGKSTGNVVGYATQQEWLPEVNETNKTKVYYIFSNES